MLPYNVILQQVGEHQIEVAALDPAASMMSVENAQLAEIAEDIKKRLERVISSL
jgi:hypothetical protein